MRVRYTPRAFADREAIFEYLNRQDPRAARKVKAFIADKIASLSYSPRRARIVKGLGVHALWLGRYPYIVYYRVSADTVRSSTSDMARAAPGPAETTENARFSLPSPMVNRALTCPLLW